MKYHKVFYRIKKLLELESENIWFETFEHAPVRTSEEAAKVRTGYTLHQGAKALILRIKNKGEKYFVMAVIPGDVRLDSQKFKTIVESNDIRFATENEILSITYGVLPGGIPPFGNLFGLEVYVDSEVLANEKIIFNAGDRRVSLGMKSNDYKKLVNPSVVDIAS